MPNDLAISVMAKNHCEDLKFKGSPECEAGFAKGFEDGYRSKKPFKRRAEDYEKLSWNNARIGTELYDYNEVLEAKITAVDRQKGIITVKYTRGGIIEPKQLEAVVNFWYVKKVSPAKK